MRKKLEKMDEMEEKEHLPLILVLPKLEGEKSPSKPDEKSTQDSKERNNNECPYEFMM